MAYQDIFRSHDLVRRGSIEELCGHRDRALELYRQAFETLAQAHLAYRRACGGDKATVGQEFLRDLHYGRPTAEKAQVEIDQYFWLYVIKTSGIESLMDAEAKHRFQDDLWAGKAPPATLANIEATITTLMADAGAIFRRGLVNAFARLSDMHKSNDGFKIGPRAILRCFVEWDRHFGFRTAYRQEDDLADISRCMYVLDGQPVPDRISGPIGVIQTAMLDKLSEAEDPYMAFRWHKNGTLHIRFLRDDLRQAANRLIAEHYGAALSGRHASANHQGSTP